MDVTLMMRPRRSLSLLLIYALQRRNTPVRSVEITCSQSSAFMRRSSMSRVMAALLMRIVGRALVASRSAASASIEAASPTFRTAPRPCTPASETAALISAAPASLVAVPTTRAPAFASASAMARPMPREAPVTRAKSFSSMGLSRSRGECRVARCGVPEREALQVRAALNAPVEPGQYLAWPAFNERLRMVCKQRAHGIRPAHRSRKLLREKRANVLRIGVRRRIDGAVVGDVGCADRDAREALGHALHGRLHQAAVRRYAHRQKHRPLCAMLARKRHGAFHARSRPSDDDLAWAVEIHRFDHSAGGCLAAHRKYLGVLK